MESVPCSSLLLAVDDDRLAADCMFFSVQIAAPPLEVLEPGLQCVFMVLHIVSDRAGEFLCPRATFTLRPLRAVGGVEKSAMSCRYSARGAG
jgi:hypothetical protein